MYGLLSTVLIVGSVLLLFWRLEPLISRALSIAEKRADIYRAEVLKPTREVLPMPRDFVEWAMNESSEWAREDKLQRMRELHDKLGDWEKVRVALMHEEETAQQATF